MKKKTLIILIIILLLLTNVATFFITQKITENAFMESIYTKFIIPDDVKNYANTYGTPVEYAPNMYNENNKMYFRVRVASNQVITELYEYEMYNSQASGRVIIVYDNFYGNDIISTDKEFRYVNKLIAKGYYKSFKNDAKKVVLEDNIVKEYDTIPKRTNDYSSIEEYAEKIRETLRKGCTELP